MPGLVSAFSAVLDFDLPMVDSGGFSVELSCVDELEPIFVSTWASSFTVRFRLPLALCSEDAATASGVPGAIPTLRLFQGLFRSSRPYFKPWAMLTGSR